MSAIVNRMQNSRFKTGWILLLIAAGLMALNHFVLIFALDEPTLSQNAPGQKARTFRDSAAL